MREDPLVEAAETPDRGAATLPEVQRRARRFASLRAAQRALSRSVHPAELEQANRQGRDLLIELQKLNAAARRTGGARSLDPRVLARVDGLLNSIATHTRQILDRLEISHLRSAVPLLSAQYPAEARGLVDLVLATGFEDDKALRMLEYLVTMLSSEERDGRRFVVCEPSEVTHRLGELARDRLERSADDDLDAERTFSNASMNLHATEDLGPMRDRMRRLKEDLGPAILHPRVLAASVSYNVAMWNRIADLIDGSRSIDELMSELLGVEPVEEELEAVEPVERVAPDAGGRAVLDSLAFARLVDAVRARVTRRSISDEAAVRCAQAFRLEGLSPAEVEAFDADEEDESARLVRAAVVLGFAARQPWDLDEPLDAVGLDAELLQTACMQELAETISARAQKLFADGRHDDAFRLSEVRTRYLGSLLGGGSGGAEAQARAARRQRAGGLRFDLGLPPDLLAVVAMLLALPLLVSVLWSPGGRSELITNQELAEISPFLESGHQIALGERTDFEGRLSRGWDYLSPEQRLRVTREVGMALSARGIDGVILRDAWDRIHARYEAGEGATLEQLARFASPRQESAPVDSP